MQLIRDGYAHRAEPRVLQTAWILRVLALFTVVTACVVLCSLMVWPVSENPAQHDFTNYPDSIANLSDTSTDQGESSDLDDTLVVLHQRAARAKASVGRLGTRQSGGGIPLRADAAEMTASLDESLRTADRYFLTNDLERARRAMKSAEQDLDMLQISFGGRY